MQFDSYNSKSFVSMNFSTYSADLYVIACELQHYRIESMSEKRNPSFLISRLHNPTTKHNITELKKKNNRKFVRIRCLFPSEIIKFYLYRWNPKFDSFILEEQYWKSTFPRTTIRFQFGLLYLLLLLIGLAIYFPAKQVLCVIIFVLNLLDDYLLNRAKINPISIRLFDRLKTSMLF